ncbi:nesprin-2 isoform X2 [Monodelphis domestica]|uniref:nesprin-2 isoform X2 n=1 Tax=Monodelphis domestica TaxID=13616 RepID=UPI0024E1C60B|nr:nesprin-2 isoform X2 [Monodelphis domestica]
MASGPMPPTKDEQLSSGIDDLHFSLQAEQEYTQKKTFTCWINSQLAKHNPPSVITDLFTDIKKGQVLLDLLEVLSGQQLAREKGSNTFQCRSNIEHALTFLKKQSIKLINIHVTDIAEGNPSIILGLIWTIILHFHIEEVAWTLSCNYNQPSLDCVSVVDLSPASGPPPKKRSKAQARWKMSAKKALLLWAQEQCAMHGSVNVTDFKSSWRNGMAFLAVIHAVRPDLIDMDSVKDRSSKDNLKEAFRIAELELNIPRLLDPEDVDVINPDEKSIMTYVAQFLQYSKDLPVAGDEVREKVKDATVWLISQEEKLHKLQMESEKETYFKKSQGMRAFVESFNEEKKAFLDVLSLKRNVVGLVDDQSRLRQAWDKLTNQINEWTAKLDQILPPPLDQIEVWLQEIEHLIAEDLPDSQNYNQTMALIKERISSFKSLMDEFDRHLSSLLKFENKDEQHMPMVPPDKLEEMRRRFHNIMGTNFIGLLEFHYYLCSVLGLIEEVKSKLNLWNIKYGTRESVELLLGDWHKFIEEKEFLIQLESSFKTCETMIKNLAGDPQNISKQFKMVESQISMCKKCMYNIKTTLQKVLSSWTTYTENLHSLKTWLEESRKEHPKQVPFETLASWNSVLTTINEVGKFLIDVSNQQVGSSINKELKRLNKRWAKFIKKTQFEMKLLFTQEQEQSGLDGTANNKLSLEKNSASYNGSTDISAEALRKHIQHLETGKENEAVIKESTEILQMLEEMEEFIDQVATWETEIRPVLDFIKQQGYVEATMEESLQNLIARGSKYQELVTRKENALEIIAKNILSQVQLQHFHTSGLQTQIKEAKDKVQNNMAELDAVLQASYETSLEIDVRAKFEKSQKELESDITKAQQLLRSKGNPGNLVSQKKDILAILNSKNLDKFLKTAEQLKNIVPPDEKLSLEQISRELSKEWEVLHQEICLYIYRIKIEIEKRLTENISKLEKQLNKEKKLLSKGKTKGLIEEHEACFFDEGSLCQLDLHMEALRELSEELTSEESRQEIRKTIIDYGQRQNEIKNAASEIYMMLKAVNENTQMPRKKKPLSTSENGGRDAGKMVQPSEPNDATSEEASGSVNFDLEYFSILKHHKEERGTEDGNVPFKNLLERYDAQRDNLELQLQSNKVRVLSEFPSEKERSISCLKDKLTDLQVLKNETDSCWTEFEITSSNLEKIVKDPERSTLSQTREKLKRKEEELQVILSKRMKSLEAALRIVLPVEKEAFLLVDSEQFLHKINIQEFNLAGVDDVYQNLKDIQRCIVKQIELCNNLEPSGSSALNEFNWIDLDAIQSIIVKYRAQFEEMNIKMQNSEMAIKALEDFLALLRKVKLSLQSTTDFSTSDIPEMQENSWTIEDVQKKISLMKEEAKCLDQRMKMLDISLKDAEQGEDTCCEKLVEVFSKMIDETHGHNEHEDFTEQVQLQEVFVAKNTDVLKNIKYIQDQINKIGLKDPTIPAVKQRIKSLTKLEKDLDYYAEEINYLKKMASSLPELKDGKGETPSQQCQETTCLWEDVKSSLEECLEQCQRAMDLLKQYHNCKSILTSLIHKEESVISLQASYMGKENLKRRIAKIEVVREEFNEHSEDVEKINQICKNLQFQLNKMITFEEPPFEKEANVIVDRWLDINEKTENYYDNLVRALALWDKLLNLTSIIDEWIEKVLRKVEVHKLNDAERTQVQEELKIQEQNSAKFGARLVEIEEFLQISEPPLELQVIKSSLLNRIEQIKMHLMDKSTLSEVNGSTAELKEDLDQAKTQIGMTESLLKALSPSDSLEIFTKLEEIQQQILQQKHNMILLENQIGCLTPELSELKKQYESINDLFSTKKRTLQDHFSNLLNDQCKKFDDWFSNIQLTLKECFESPETKKCMEEKLQKLNDSLTFEGKTKDIQEVQTALNNVKRHLPKASVKRLSNWIVARELELQKMKFSCQMQAKQLHDCLQQLLRLQEDYINLSKWLMNQEEKWKEIGVEKEPDFFCQALTRKRQLFESLAELNNSLKKFGLTREEIVIESTNLIEKYETFLTQVCEKGNHQSPAAVDQSFEDLVHDVFSWIMGIKESLMVLNSTEGKMPLEERIQKIKEIILLKPEGDMKIQNIMSLGETGKASLVQDTLSDIKNQWDHTIHLANTYLSHQEKIQLEGEKYLQSKDDLRLMLTELKKKQESGFALQNGLQGKKAQLKIYKKFLQKAEDLTSLLNELKTQGNYLLECTKNPKFSEEKWLEIKHLHESLLHQLQDSVSKLEGHVQEHQLYQDLVADLNTTLENFYQKFLGFPDNLVDEKAAEEKMLTLQELEALLNLKGDTLEKILVLAESIKQNSSSVGQKTIKDETDSLKYKYKNLENRLESVKEETENSFNSILKSKSEIKKKEETAMKKREEQVSSDTQDSIHESITVEKLKERGEVKKVGELNGKNMNKKQPMIPHMKDSLLLSDCSPQPPIQGNIGESQTVQAEVSSKQEHLETIDTKPNPFEKNSVPESIELLKVREKSDVVLVAHKSQRESATNNLKNDQTNDQISHITNVIQEKLITNQKSLEDLETKDPLTTEEQVASLEKSMDINDQAYKRIVQDFQLWLSSKEQLLDFIKQGEPVTEKTLSIFENSSLEMLLSKQLSPEAQESMKNIEDEQRVNELQNQPLDLDIISANEQLKEIEVLYRQLEAKKANIGSQEPIMLPHNTETSALNVKNIQHSENQLDRLLQALVTLKEDKERQYCLIKDFQDHLLAIKSSVKALSMEKENTKAASMESKQQLKKLEKCLESIHKEKDSLSKLKEEQENLSSHLSEMDKKLAEKQVKQLELCWEQVEQWIQKKYSQQGAEWDEFQCLMNKIQDMENSLQDHHQQQQLKLNSPPELEEHKDLMFLATKLNIIKNNFSLLRGRVEHQMKRIWGKKEKKKLETAISNLQEQLEELEPLTKEKYSQMKNCKIMKKIQEAMLWVNNLLIGLDQTAALLPDNIVSQIKKHKMVHNEVLDKQPIIESLIEETKGVIPDLDQCEATDLNTFLDELQSLNQALVSKCTEIAEQLETRLEERSTFFEKLGKVQSSLQGKEVLITPEIKTASSKEDLDQYLVTLNDTQKELQNTDRLISTHFQEATDFSKCLNIFEQIFLIDQLRNLKNKARWTQRLMQNKHHEVRKKLDIYTEFFEKTDMLQQELSQIRNHALLLNRKPNHGTKEEICELRERTSVLQSNIIQIMKHKDIFESLGLNWDSSHLDKVQAELLKIITELEEKTKQLERVNIENVKLQTSLNELQMVTLQIKKELAEIVNDTSFSPESRLLSAQILSQRIEKATYLCQETIDLLSANETNKESFKQEIPQIRLLAEENNKLHKFLQNVVENFQPRSVGEKDFRDQLECALLVLTEVNFQLQQPLEVGLEIKHIQEEKDNCEALQKRVKAELCQIKAITVKEYPRQEDNSHETRDLESKVNELEDLQLQFDKGFALRMNILDEALENMKHFNKAVTRAVGLINSFKTKVNSHKIDLDNLGESQQLTDWKQEEFKALIVDLKNLTSKLENITGPKDKVQLEHVLCEIINSYSLIKESAETKKADLERCLKSYEGFNKTKQKICAILNKVEGGLQQSISQEAMSYREALERLEQSKNFVSDLVSTQEELTKLRQDFRCLRFMCTENDSICLLKTVSALWERWLSLFENAREWEMFCEELKQDWKFVSEEIEREAIILDNLQEEFPESTKPKEAATNKELSEALECFCQYEENLEREQLLFTLLLHRIKNILSVPESLEITESVPVLQEIRSMQDRCTKLSQKVQGNKELIQLEIEERNNISKEIMSLKNSLEKMTATFRDMPLEEHPEKEDHMEALQKIIDKEKLALENIMEKLRIKYSEMYTIVPAEIECQMEECKKALEDIDEKIRNEVLKSSPSYMMREKIEEINHGLQNVEKMLQQKSKNIEQAQEIQKKMWDELDLWHCKLNELDSEVQDIVEQDPGQAQEWMDNLMVPFQQYQQVSQRAEHRTSQLNKAILKMEEYNDFLRNTETWIENTSSLLAGPTDYSSSKALSHHANTLQMALEDSEQKQNLLHLVYSDLEEFSAIFETDDFAPIKLNQLSARVTNLQQKIIASLPQIQHMADEVIAIENEVKSIEKKVSKIKAILFSKEIFDFSPEEHLKHGEVILDNIKPMKKAIAEIESYQVVLRLPETGMKSLPVFERTNQLLQDVKMLEKATHEKNEILKLVMKQTGECDQEIEKLKYLLKNYSTELSPENFSPDQATTLPHVQREIDSIKEQILNLNQKKEDLLMGLKTTVLALHQRLQQEKQELEKETEESGLAERDVSEWKLKRKGSMSLPPSIVEEVEESSLKSENGDERTESASSPWSIQWGNERNKEEDRASSSSGTLIQEVDGRISTYDGHDTQMFALNPLKNEQDLGSSSTHIQQEVGDTPSIGVPFQSSGEEQGSLEEIVASSRPESVEILHVCQKQVAELELWLDKANLSFRAETLNPEMQQMVEQELAGCQAMLTEIEHKVSSLLENCKDQSLGDSGRMQQEAEMLSLKLKAVKYNLEKVQVMLQDKYSDEKRSNNLKKPSEDQKIQQSDRSPLFEPIVFESPMFGRQKGFQQKVLELNPEEQKDLIKFIEIHAEKMWHQKDQRDDNKTQESVVSPGASHSRNGSLESFLPSQEQSEDKWYYLLQELSKEKLPSPQLADDQIAVNVNFLPMVPMHNVRSPTVEELKTYTSQLEDLSQEANVFHTQENPTSEPSLNLDKKIFDLLLSISQCLSNMEGMLQTSGLSREDAAIQQVHYEMLSLELQKLHSSITNKKEDLLKLISHSGKNSSVFFECFKNLQTRLEETRTAAASRSQSMKSGIDHNSDYQSQLRQLYDQLIEKKSSMQHSLNEISNQSIGEQLQKADSYAVKLQDYEVQVAKLRDEGERLYLPYVLIQEVYKLEDILDDMWGLLRAKHAELNSPFISESQQEGLLRGLVELLTIGKEKLGQDQRQQIKSKCSLQAQLQNHKGFFQKLVADVFLIQAYSKKALPPLLQNKEKFWTDMVKEVKLLEQHACQYGMKLENLLQKWKEFDENYESLEKDLEILGSSLPSTSLVEETEERLMERISFYQQIKRNIDEKHTKLYQTTNEGKHLTTAVNCPELDSQISKLEEQWLALNKKVDHELHRLQTLLKHLVSYNKDSDELTRWLESAQQTLNYWKEQSLNVSQDLDTIRSNINNFFEFSKEVDEKSSLKTSVISTGNQLLHLKEADTATLRSSLAQFEQKWATLITQLPDIQEKLHQLQMEKLPSRQAITEMINWMDSIEQQIADEATLDSQSSVSQVKNLLQKYKESRMEMNYKQWIVDFVNQSLLQLSTSDVESKRYERTEFAERLGEMNRQWHKLHGTLNRKIQHLEQLLESITESENKIQTLRSWMEAQGERLKALQKPGSVISVRRTLLDCQDLENHLTTKSRALDDLKQNYMALESGPMPVLQDTISGINDLYQMRNNIVNQVNQLKTSMQSVLHQEKGYDKLFEEVNMMTIRFWYCVEHSKPDVYSLEALRCQVKNLQFLQDEAESSEGNWSELQDAINKLKDYCPSVTEIIKQKYQEARTRWTQVNHEVAEQLQSAQSMLQLWESYTVAHTEATAKLDQLEEKLKHILTINMSGDNLTEILIQALKDAENLQNELQNIKETFLQNSAVIEPNLEQAGPVKQDVLSNQSSSLQRISYLEKMLLMKSNEFEHVLSQLKDFRHQLESLEDSIKHSVQSWDLQGREDDPERFLNHMLELTALSPDMEHLNEVSFKLPLSDIDIKTLQNLNRKWSQAAATALEKCSELQGTGSNEKFLHKCENWIQFLEKIEKCLKMNLAGRLEDLLEQQKTFEMLQAEISVNQPIADYFVTQSLQLLDTPEIEKRTEFVMKLTMLKEQWQDATQRAQQRKNTINERVKEWQRFNASLQNVIHFLTDTDHFLSAIKSRDCYSLCQIRSLIHDLKNKEVLLQRQQTTCTLILEAGRKLLMIADPETKDSIDRKTRELQDTWKNSQFQVAEITKQFQSTIETWDRCEKQIKELESRLHTLKAKIKDPLPEPYEELYKEKELIKELEKSLSNWAQNLKELNIMKADLTRYILVEDVMVLKEQIDHLHRQWEELCLRVSLRKQEIEERLNSWIVFNEKNKDLCAWLVQMENKVLQTADISIEEMIERLQKDCMEEINLFSENKLHLKQMGDQLIKASNKTRVAEIDDKLSKINDRWQHLFDVIGSRVKKLKETFAFIQQLDKNMSNLRSWLARIESELSKPVVYDICDDQEIQKRLAEQQDLQRDIEQHSAGVESVFNICDVLLHDSDACANETECDSIQQTTRSLDRRWRNICAMSMERRMKIEETWRLWQKFLDDYSRFEDWLKSAEKTAAHPNSSEVLYTNAKEELKKFEAFQWQIHERLTQLELINKQYRRLARENRTDTASKLKQMVHEGNQRWDNLQKRVTAILRRLKHFTNQREEFEGTRESILVWLTEMDLQLTNVEHFSESDVDDKMRQLHGFQQEITLNTNKIDQLIVFGEQLIQKSEPMDAVLIEDELEELHRYCQEVFGRVARFHRRLTSHNPGLEDEKEASENETDVEDSREIQTDSWHKKEVNEGPSSPQSLCHLMPPPLGHERSGCETPVSVDSIPLEWDHTGDVGGSSSHEDDEEGPYYSAVSGKSISEAHSWHTPDSPTHPKHHYKQTEVERNVLPITPETSTPYKPEYVKQLIPPGIDGVDDGREGSRMLNAGEQKGLTETEQQAGVFDSWKLIQAQDLRNKLRTKHNLQQWQQLDSDINDVTLWLKGTEAELEDLEMAKPAADIQETELRVKKLKDILKAFDNYKALVVSINLSSKKFQQPDNTESKELQNRLRQLNLLWEKANHLLDSWRESLQHSLMQCQDFHQLSQSLLLWLASAENRRCTVQAQVMDSNADPHTILECQKELMQLEKELLEHQHQVSSLQEISKYLLAKGDEDNYIEADEKVHVIGKKLNQLLDQVAQDLESLQDSQDVDTSLLSFDEVDSGGHHLSSTSMSAAGEKVGEERNTEGKSKKNSRVGQLSDPGSTSTSSGSRSFLYRVFRAALPLQLFFLLLLLLACMIPSSEEDYSCTQANNFARSFYPMLRYTNGPPPT